MAEVRAVPDRDLDDFLGMEVEVYTIPVTFPDADGLRAHLSPEAVLASYEEGRIAGRLIVYPLQMHLNGSALSMGGVSGVGVRPEYRRRSHASALLRAAMATMRNMGQSISVLFPTFYRLYRRNGFAMASQTHRYRFRARDLFLPSENEPDGRFTVSQSANPQALSAIYDAHAAGHNGALARDPWWWEEHVLYSRTLPPSKSVVWSSMQGAPEGYMLFRQTWIDAVTRERPLINPAAQRLDVVELIACTRRAYRALVGWVAANDLADDGNWNAPDGDPLPSMLLDPRGIAQTTLPGFMLRVIDLPAALSARPAGRGADRNTSVRLNIADQQADWNSGAWEISLEDGRLTARRSPSGADAACDISTLSAIYNGYLDPLRAWQGGLLQGDEASARALKECFQVDERPWIREVF